MPAPRPRIFLKLILTAFFWGGTWITGRSAVQEMAPLAVASWRFLLATLILGALLYRTEEFPRWSVKEWSILGCLGLTGVFLYNVCFLYGLQHVEAGRGSLVVAFIPAIIALAGWLLLTAGALINGSLFDISATTWRTPASIGFLAIFGTAVAFTWYSEAIGHVGSTRAAAFINLVPVFAVLLGALLLDERLGGSVLAGGAAVIVGVLMTHRAGRPPSNRLDRPQRAL